MSDSPPRSSEPRPRLGRGLAALLGDVKSDNGGAGADGVKQVPIEFIRSSARNPRQVFGEEELEDLAASIRERGIIQPILVRPVAGINDTYEIVAGERRWRAAQRAGHHTVPVIVKQIGDRDALEISIVENVQRADLNALEEARGYSLLAAEYGYNQADIGRVVGKSRSHVANTLRLMGLPEHCRDLLSNGAISAGHARALLSVPHPDSVADRVVAHGLTVRDVEKLSEGQSTAAREAKPLRNVDAATKELENKLTLALGTEVVILESKKLKQLRIKYKDLEQLEHLCEVLLRQQ